MTNLHRKYTVAELYDMRKALTAMLPTLTVEDSQGLSYLLVEARLLVCVLNGTTLDELEAYWELNTGGF